MKKSNYEDMQYHLNSAEIELRQAQECLVNGTEASEMICNIAEQINRLQNLLARVQTDDTYNILGN